MIGKNILHYKIIKKLGEGGMVALTTAIEYATQIAEDLKAAHDKKIVHRDIKSAH